MATITDKLCLAWTGDYESLRQFVKDSLKLEGVWTQPGGDKKVFETNECSISWRRNSKLLYIEGGKTSEVKKKIYDCFFDKAIQLSQLAVHGHSCEARRILTEIEDLKSGQLVNGEAIKASALSVSFLTNVLLQLQDCGSKGEEYFYEVKQTNQLSQAQSQDQHADSSTQISSYRFSS